MPRVIYGLELFRRFITCNDNNNNGIEFQTKSNQTKPKENKQHMERIIDIPTKCKVHDVIC